MVSFDRSSQSFKMVTDFAILFVFLGLRKVTNIVFVFVLFCFFVLFLLTHLHTKPTNQLTVHQTDIERGINSRVVIHGSTTLLNTAFEGVSHHY